MANFLKLFFFFFTFAYSLSNVKAANILCLVGTAEHSIPTWSQPFLEALAARGHNLTLISTAQYENFVGNASFINLDNNYDVIGRQYMDAGTGAYRDFWPFKHMLIWHEAQLGSCRELVKSPDYISAIKQLRKPDLHYDLIIFDGTYGTDCLLSLTQLHPEAPIMALSSAKLNTDIFDLAQAPNTQSAAAVPHFTSNFPLKMNYFQRLHNHVLYLAEIFLKALIINPVRQRMLPQGPEGSAESRIKIVLLNTHPTLDYIQQLPPKVIEIGGLHIAETPKRLPKDLLQFTEEYDDGLIYIDLTYLHLLTASSLQAIIENIKHFGNYGFIWYIDHKNKKLFNIQQVPKNLYIANEQLDRHAILALPNTKVLLSHGDSFSLQEAIYNGIPVMALPLILEQFSNAQRLHERQLGLKLTTTDLNEAELTTALNELLNNDKYARKLQRVQQSFRKRPLKPLALAVWYAEQLIADPDSFEELAAGRTIDLNYFVRHSLDIILLPFVFTIMFFLNAYFIISQSVNSFKKRKNESNKPTLKPTRSGKLKDKQTKRDKKDAKKRKDD